MSGVELTLEKVQSPAWAGSGPYESFSLIFSGPGHILLPQGDYPFRHAVLDAMSIFITPVERTETGFRYQADFTIAR
ncbi:MAG: hypothetical protein HQK58_16390 [Deltaproteobacteria bacterium]|nr:hypothetical protein [Deltaproteobacteria bacterium]